MSEENESKKLALWLEGELDVEDIPSALQEAVFVFRPDLAPKPQLTVVDVLNELKRGPLVNEEEPSEDVVFDEDEQVLLELNFEEAHPQLELEDILATVTKGPLNSPKLEESSVVRFPVQPNRNQSVLSSDDQKPSRKTFAFAGFLAAACALIVLLPTNYELPPAPDAQHSLPVFDESTQIEKNQIDKEVLVKKNLEREQTFFEEEAQEELEVVRPKLQPTEAELKKKISQSQESEKKKSTQRSGVFNEALAPLKKEMASKPSSVPPSQSASIVVEAEPMMAHSVVEATELQNMFDVQSEDFMAKNQVGAESNEVSELKGALPKSTARQRSKRSRPKRQEVKRDFSMSDEDASLDELDLETKDSSIVFEVKIDTDRVSVGEYVLRCGAREQSSVFSNDGVRFDFRPGLGERCVLKDPQERQASWIFEGTSIHCIDTEALFRCSKTN
ncbi:MAG: hypothetical protein CMK59_14940 [Proteobacteria bacterium]|nr:hypothetical protein [Pseudomonadota bacterium]